MFFYQNLWTLHVSLARRLSRSWNVCASMINSIRSCCLLVVRRPRTTNQQSETIKLSKKNQIPYLSYMHHIILDLLIRMHTTRGCFSTIPLATLIVSWLISGHGIMADNNHAWPHGVSRCCLRNARKKQWSVAAAANKNNRIWCWWCADRD